jgi:hypothetical protein
VVTDSSIWWFNAAVNLNSFARAARSHFVSLTVAAAVVLTGCTNTSIAAARRDLAASRYAAAHQKLVAAQRADGQLSYGERREVWDDLCLTEYKIGAPTYPLAEQYRMCAEAVMRGGSINSRQLSAKIENSERAVWSNAFSQALATGDIARASDAVLRYRSVPGAEQSVVASRSKQVWAMIARQEKAAAKSRSSRIDPAISEVAREYRDAKAMNDRAFRQWVDANLTVSGISMVSSVDLRKHSLNLRIPDDRLHAAALNLDRFARINDALVARCQCDARTNIAMETTGLPAYLVRLDPETRHSAILILTQP